MQSITLSQVHALQRVIDATGAIVRDGGTPSSYNGLNRAIELADDLGIDPQMYQDLADQVGITGTQIEMLASPKILENDGDRRHWHRYGAVEIAIVPITVPNHDMQPELDHETHGRYVETISMPGSPAQYDTREFQRVTDWDDRDIYGDPQSHWIDRADGEKVDESRDHAPIELLDAAATLAWHEYERFQAADRAMGDAAP